MDYKKVNQLPMFFVVGVPRSGTTMLQQMLDANPAVITPVESMVVIFLKQKYFKKKNWTRENVTEFIEDLYSDPMFVKGWNIDKDLLTETYQAIPLKDVKYDLLLKIAYYSYPSIYNKAEIRLLGDKNPLYTMFIDEIKEVFPSARFIHIIRDYRANILSNRKWFLRKKISILAHKWLVGNKFIENQKHRFPENFYTVRYEDLVEDPEKYAKEISNFLNIEYDQSMVEFHKKAHEVYIDSSSKDANMSHKKLIETLHENIIKPIHKDNVETWKTELTKEEIALADYIVLEYAKQYNYKAMYSEKSFNFWKKSFLAKMRMSFDMFVIREYPRSPRWIKKMLRLFSIMLYKYFGVVHVFNSELNQAKAKPII